MHINHPSRPAQRRETGAEPALRSAACVILYALARGGLRQLVQVLGGPGSEALQWGGLLAATVLAAVPPLYWAVAVLGLRWQQLGVRRPRRRMWGALVLYVAVLCAFSLASRLLGVESGRGVQLPQGRAALCLAFLQLCVASPLVEELLFRGAVQRLLRPYGAAAAIAGQAVLFAALHGGVVQIAFALPMGLLLGWTAWRSGSLCAGLLLHGLNNAILFAGLLAGGGI